MANSVIEMACERIDGQIADLVRAKDIIIGAAKDVPVTSEPKKRGRKKKQPGLPASETGA